MDYKVIMVLRQRDSHYNMKKLNIFVNSYYSIQNYEFSKYETEMIKVTKQSFDRYLIKLGTIKNNSNFKITMRIWESYIEKHLFLNGFL